MTRVIGYVRVSTADENVEAQRVAIRQECERKDWQLVAMLEDSGLSGSIAWQDRPGLTEAVRRIEQNEADMLVCAKLDRLSRSLVDFAGLLDRARRKKWSIALLDFGLDMSTPVGEMVAGILASVAQFERRRIGERTREGLAVRRAKGVRLGRRSVVPAEVIQEITHDRANGMSFTAIARSLNEQRIPTPQGGTKWRDTSVRAIVRWVEAASD